MSGLKFDENLAIREVLDDIVGMVDRREKLIRSASELADRSRDDLAARNVKRLEGYMVDFLTLFQPVMAKVQSYGESLRDSIRETENYLKSLVGIIDAGKSVEGSSATIQELEKDANGVAEELDLMHDALDKIQALFEKTKKYMSPIREEPKDNTQTAKWQPESRVRGSRDFLARTRFSTGQPTKSQY